MVLEFVKSVTHKCQPQEKQTYSDNQIKDVLLGLMKKNNIDTSKVKIADDGRMEIYGEPNLKFHNLMLEIERLGLATKYTKKTSLEIVN